MINPITVADPHHGWNVIAVGGDATDALVAPDRPVLVPPVEWAQYTDATCDTSWCNQGHDMRYDDGHSRRCFDCVDGQPKVEVRPPCPKCRGAKCRECRNEDDLLASDGLVRWGWAHSFKAVPIIEVPDTGYPHGAPNLFCYVSKPGALRLVDRIAKTDTYIRPNPDAQPGMWALVATLEEDQ